MEDLSDPEQIEFMLHSLLLLLDLRCGFGQYRLYDLNLTRNHHQIRDIPFDDISHRANAKKDVGLPHEKT